MQERVKEGEATELDKALGEASQIARVIEGIHTIGTGRTRSEEFLTEAIVKAAKEGATVIELRKALSKTRT